uniref:Uncharacterized protein n=1 Tax=Nelumbo nucifera TaxID=4432 RepID=A0A822Y3T7_NELNU|nr:TPA_asm: hypothetical protein HUJ06_027354 [Nelumbo nucifera]
MTEKFCGGTHSLKNDKNGTKNGCNSQEDAKYDITSKKNRQRRRQ